MGSDMWSAGSSRAQVGFTRNNSTNSLKLSGWRGIRGLNIFCYLRQDLYRSILASSFSLLLPWKVSVGNQQ